jgi:hypothetical protein
LSFEVREKAIFWLGAVRGDEGYRRLSARYASESESRLREQIVFAIHLSKAEGAIPKLVEIARKDRDSDVRERALFWLAQRAGAVAARAIATAAREDPDLEVKKQAVFALSQLPEDEGVPLLVEVADPPPPRSQEAGVLLARSVRRSQSSGSVREGAFEKIADAGREELGQGRRRLRISLSSARSGRIHASFAVSLASVPTR